MTGKNLFSLHRCSCTCVIAVATNPHVYSVKRANLFQILTIFDEFKKKLLCIQKKVDDQLQAKLDAQVKKEELNLKKQLLQLKKVKQAKQKQLELQDKDHQQRKEMVSFKSNIAIQQTKAKTDLKKQEKRSNLELSTQRIREAQQFS